MGNIARENVKLNMQKTFLSFKSTIFDKFKELRHSITVHYKQSENAAFFVEEHNLILIWLAF